jgi:AAA domain
MATTREVRLDEGKVEHFSAADTVNWLARFTVAQDARSGDPGLTTTPGIRGMSAKHLPREDGMHDSRQQGGKIVRRLDRRRLLKLSGAGAIAATASKAEPQPPRYTICRFGKGTFASTHDCVFLAGLYRAEREIAEKLKGLAIGKPPWPAIEQRTKLALADSQRGAVRVALASKVVVITGGPGVGKTTQGVALSASTLVNSILKILLAKTIAISLCAPTGRAAKRLSESTGLEAETIHRLLETEPRTGAFGDGHRACSPNATR